MHGEDQVSLLDNHGKNDLGGFPSENGATLIKKQQNGNRVQQLEESQLGDLVLHDVRYTSLSPPTTTPQHGLRQLHELLPLPLVHEGERLPRLLRQQQVTLRVTPTSLTHSAHTVGGKLPDQNALNVVDLDIASTPHTTLSTPHSLVLARGHHDPSRVQHRSRQLPLQLARHHLVQVHLRHQPAHDRPLRVVAVARVQLVVHVVLVEHPLEVVEQQHEVLAVEHRLEVHVDRRVRLVLHRVIPTPHTPNTQPTQKSCPDRGS